MSICCTVFHIIQACVLVRIHTPFCITALELTSSSSLCGLEVDKTVIDITSILLFYIIGSCLKGILIVLHLCYVLRSTVEYLDYPGLYVLRSTVEYFHSFFTLFGLHCGLQNGRVERKICTLF